MSHADSDPAPARRCEHDVPWWQDCPVCGAERAAYTRVMADRRRSDQEASAKAARDAVPQWLRKGGKGATR